MTNPTRKADDVLGEFKTDVESVELAWRQGRIGDEERTEDLVGLVLTAQKALHEGVCKNVIGEDQEVRGGYDVQRNNLRAKQRKAAAQYFGQEEKQDV